MLFVCHPKILHKHCLQFLLGVKMAPRETENNTYAKFWGYKQRALWYVMVFLEWSISLRGRRWLMFLVRFYVLPGERRSKKFLPSPLKNGRLLRRLTLNSYVFVQKYDLTVRRGVVVGRLVRLFKISFHHQLVWSRGHRFRLVLY